MVAGLEDVTAGEIRIGGRVVNDLPPRDRDIAMVFQSYALYPHMKVRDNMAFGLKLRKISRTEIRDRVGRAAKILGLNEHLDRYPRHLSGGQRQRVAMGRAIVRDPQVFLFDEPLSNLDAKLRTQMRTEVKELHSRLQTTSIYVTHDQVEAMTMAEKIVVLHEGKVAQMGPPLDVYDRPENLFVAGFIGSPAMNFIEGTVHRGDGKVGVATTDGTLVPVPDNGELREGASVVAGIRPEHLTVGGRGAGLRAKVMVTEPTGAEELVVCQLAGQTCKVVTHQRHSFSIGEEIELHPEMDSMHVFDGDSGMRLGS